MDAVGEATLTATLHPRVGRCRLDGRGGANFPSLQQTSNHCNMHQCKQQRRRRSPPHRRHRTPAITCSEINAIEMMCGCGCVRERNTQNMANASTQNPYQHKLKVITTELVQEQPVDLGLIVTHSEIGGRTERGVGWGWESQSLSKHRGVSAPDPPPHP